MSTAPRVALADGLREGVRQWLYAYYALFKIIVPVYIIIALLKLIHVVDWLAGTFAPFMKFWGLPGEASLVLASGWTVNLYGAIAALAGLDFTVRQVTILAIILSISHSLVMETAIVSRMKGRPWLILILRLTAGLAAGAVLNLMLPGML
jgi:hypothetical protein